MMIIYSETIIKCIYYQRFCHNVKTVVAISGCFKVIVDFLY